MNPQHGHRAGNPSMPAGWAVPQPEPRRIDALESSAFGVRQLARLHEAGMACARGAVDSGLLDTLLQLVLEVTDSEIGTVHVLEAGTRRLRLAAHRGVAPELVELCDSDRGLREICHAACDSRRRMVEDNVAASPSVSEDVREALRRLGVVAFDVAPLLLPGEPEPAGALSIYRRQPFRAADSQLRLADVLIRQAGDFLELSRSRQATEARIAAEHEARRRAEEASRSKDQFLATLSHEMRQPLSAILPAIAVYQRTPADDRRQRAADVIAHQLRQLRRLVEDLADTSAVSRGVAPLRREEVSLRAILRQVLESMGPMFERKRHQVTADLGSGPAWISADPARMHQVFSNLLQNAAAYTPPGGRIAVALAAEGPTLRVCVRDSGVGIPPDALERVFDMFERGAQRHGTSGVGIGLALVRQIAELHGGSVSVTSTPGEGSEFQVVLPGIGDR